MSWSLCRVDADVTAPRCRCASVLTRPFSRAPLSPPPCSSHAPASRCRGCPSPRAWHCGPGSSARTSLTRSSTATTPSCWGRASYASAAGAASAAAAAAPAAAAAAASAVVSTAARATVAPKCSYSCTCSMKSTFTATIDAASASAAVSTAARATACSCCLLHGRCSYSCTYSPATLLHVRVASRARPRASVHDHGPTS